MKLRLFVTFVIFLFLVSCAKNTQKSITLKMFNYKMEYESKLTHIADMFSEKYKGRYKIEIESVPYEAYLVLESRLKTNNGWDIIMVPPSRAIVTNTLTQYFFDITDEKIYDNILKNTLNLVSYNNRIYALPYGLNVYALFYNKDIFEKNNLLPPDNLEDLKKLVDTLKSKNITPFSISTKDDWLSGYLFYMLLSASMGTSFDNWLTAMNNGISSFNTPKINEVFDTLDFYKKNGGNSFRKVDFNEQLLNFANEKSAMIFQNYNEINLALSKNKNLNIGFFPYSITNTTKLKLCVDVDFAFAISKTIDNKKLKVAKEFLNFIVSNEVFSYFDKNTNMILSTKNYNSTKLRSEFYDFIDKNEITYWQHRKVPSQVFEKSKAIINNYINNDIDRNSAILELDRAWSTSQKK